MGVLVVLDMYMSSGTRFFFVLEALARAPARYEYASGRAGAWCMCEREKVGTVIDIRVGNHVDFFDIVVSKV